MPRHPPFALKDLKSHEFVSKNRSKTRRIDSKLTNEMPHQMPWHQYELPERSSQRCSRPLCSSQSTGGTLPAYQQSRQQEKVQRFVTPDPKASASGPSGPNSVHVPSLRTPHRFQPASERTKMQSLDPSHLVNVPPMSYQSRTCVSNLAPGQPRRAARCSLERR